MQSAQSRGPRAQNAGTDPKAQGGDAPRQVRQDSDILFGHPRPDEQEQQMRHDAGGWQQQQQQQQQPWPQQQASDRDREQLRGDLVQQPPEAGGLSHDTARQDEEVGGQHLEGSHPIQKEPQSFRLHQSETQASRAADRGGRVSDLPQQGERVEGQTDPEQKLRESYDAQGGRAQHEWQGAAGQPTPERMNARREDRHTEEDHQATTKTQGEGEPTRPLHEGKSMPQDLKQYGKEPEAGVSTHQEQKAGPATTM